MGTSLEDLRILKSVEVIADGVWHDVMRWNRLAQNTVGEQVIRSADSIGANISESFGRFHYGKS